MNLPESTLSGMEISPFPPVLIAYTGKTGGYPAVTKTRLSIKTGDPTVISELGANRQSSSPVTGLYPRMYLLALVTSSSRVFPWHNVGVPQEEISSRFVFHISAPVFRSKAAIKESLERSH